MAGDRHGWSTMNGTLTSSIGIYDAPLIPDLMFFISCLPFITTPEIPVLLDIYLQEKGGTWNHTEMDSRGLQSGLALW